MRKRQCFRKQHRVKKKKSIFSHRFFWLAVFVLLICGGIFYLICFSSFFQIKQIEISGNQKVLVQSIQEIIQRQVQQRVLFFSTKSIFLVNLEKIDKILLEEFSQIAKVNLERNFPDALIVRIEEREPVAVFEQQDRRFFTDKEGIIFKEIENGQEPEYLKIESLIFEKELILGRQIFEKELIEKFLEIKRQLNRKEIPITSALIVSDERVNVKTLESWEIYFNLRDDISNQIFNLGLVLDEKIPPEKRKNIEYVDLRFGSRVFFRYRDD